MKKYALMFFAGILVLPAFAQKVREADVPAIVKKAFHEHNPEVTLVTWEKENANFEAEFKKDGQEISVIYDEYGKLLETEVEIGKEKLPAGCAAYVQKELPGSSIRKAELITDDKGIITYEVETKRKSFLFDTTGNFIREIKD